MNGAPERVSLPYASVRGSWEVLRRTGDDRTTVAIRDDEDAGVAVSYPYAEWRDGGSESLKVGVVRNLRQGYVLVSGSFGSVEAIPESVTDGREQRRVSLERFTDLSDGEVMELLEGGRPVVVEDGSEAWYPGALQLFESTRAARDAWLRNFPRLEKRFVAVERLIRGTDLRSVIDAGGASERVHTP